MRELFKTNILGTEYTVIEKYSDEDSLLNEYDGYCDDSVKQIIIECFEEKLKGKKSLPYYIDEVLRHEMVHAYLFESGLATNSIDNWAMNEEMVDWIAKQLPKMVKEMVRVGVLK